MLHGRQPGRLRARVDARRCQAAARRCHQRQAAAADDGAVLRRRADDLADLPRCGSLCARGRLLQRAGRDQRHPLRAGCAISPRQAREAGLRIAYLQFDGVSEEANAHRKVGNLFEVKLRAIENLHAAGIDVCLVVTIVNGINNDQVGPIIKFALENCDKISFVSFQPVSFTGRDEDISDADRHAQRYTLSHLADDLKQQTGVTEPLRDWFPLSASSVMSDVTDLLLGPGGRLGHAEMRLPS